MRFRADVTPTDQTAAADALRRLTPQLSGRDTLVVVLAYLGREIVGALSSFAYSGGSATVNFRLRSDGVAAIHATTSTAHVETGAIAFASLTLGAPFVLPLPSEGLAYERFLGVQVVTGTATTTAGSVNMFLTTEPSKSPTTSYPDAINE